MLRTPLYAAHKAAGARFTEFGGWEMPVQYRGLLAEHAAVREGVGLFDVSHMGEIEIRGPQALALCLSAATNDATRLADGRAQYTLLCEGGGGTIDDTILYRLAADRFLFCVNAGNRAACSAWLQELARGKRDCAVVDRSEQWALLSLQGPLAAELAARLGAGWLADLSRFSIREGQIAGVPVLGARTGYTGEDGFEFFVAPERVVDLWAVLLGEGEVLGVERIGLGARDTLRLEAGLPLYGHELTREISPLEAGLGWAVKEARGGFPGAEALGAIRRAGPARSLIGICMAERGIARAGYPVIADDSVVGHVTSGTKSPTLGDAIALALVAAESLARPLAVEVRGKKIAARRIDLPFYRRQ